MRDGLAQTGRAWECWRRASGAWVYRHRGQNLDHLQLRARQNVIWEWGYLIARLGRQNVICIYKGGVEMPSDLQGLVTIHVAEDLREKAEEIRRELNAAGYDVR